MKQTYARPRFSRPERNNGLIHHRTAVTAADKLATPGTLTVTDAGAGGNLANSQQNVAVSAFNRWGNTVVSTGNVTPTASHRVRIAFAAVTGADGYDIFCSTDANPKWVARITEAQRAAGGIVDALGVYGAGGAVNSIDIGVAGTGLASNVNPFAANTAARPDNSNITAIDCHDYEYLDLLSQLTVTDLRSLPSLILTGYYRNESSTADWVQFWAQTVSLLTAVQQPLEQNFRVLVAGAPAVVFCVDSIAGQGASLELWADLE